MSWDHVDKRMLEYLEVINNKYCECGISKTYGEKTNIPHSTWCPSYMHKPKPPCTCGVGDWHSVGCSYRVDKKKEL
jgi:hypothetical protein